MTYETLSCSGEREGQRDWDVCQIAVKHVLEKLWLCILGLLPARVRELVHG